jgi:hypothetical protein
MSYLEKIMRLLESFIRWLERRYERKLEKYCLIHGQYFATATRPCVRDHSNPRNHYPRSECWLLGIATGRFNDIAMHRVRVAMPFNPHSVDQKEIHHER